MLFRASLLLLLLSTSSFALADNPPQELGELLWHEDYGTAFHAARKKQRMLLIHFDGEDQHTENLQATLADEEVQGLCRQFELLRVPADYEIAFDNRTKLLSHSSFAAMGNKPGLAIVDLRDTDSEHFGQTVSALPFGRSLYYAPSLTSKQAITTLLELPTGSITQRSMVLAVRLHPERPASTLGRADAYVFQEAAGHSAHMAHTGVQGHQGFETRFHRINANLGGSAAKEVVAESWPGEDLLAACFSCVKSWRGSPGHWSAVSGSHASYGYDIRRSSRGVWYATGLFADR